jgi:uncharacterized membrane protein YdcZ (DUF606 family)
VPPVTKLLFVIAGLINALPLVGVLGSAQLASLYGQTVSDPDLLLLLRHRAVLFGLLGALLIAAAFRVQLRTGAATAGLISMASYCLLALPLDTHGGELQRVFWVDVVALPLLAVAWWLSRTERRGGS